MKFFVNTKLTQGSKKNDFSFPKEGEIVIPPEFVCSTKAKAESCGCNRALDGIDDHQGTTTALVIQDNNIGLRELTALIFASKRRAGWNWTYDKSYQLAERVSCSANCFAAGTIVGYRDGKYYIREQN